MTERPQDPETASPDTTRRQLLTTLVGGLLALFGLSASISQSEAKRRSKKKAQLVALPRPR